MSNPSKACERCGAPRPPGRTRYCGDDCAGAARRESVRAKDDLRISACKRCQGPKEPGVRGGKYCNECRRLIEDTSTQRERERGRRRSLARTASDIAEGKRLKLRLLDVPEGSKWCARCQEFRPVTSFPGRKDTGKQSSYCKPCQRSYNQERRVLLVYGLTWDEYDLLLACQEGRCAICGGTPRRYALAVDHDHRTGEIRGLLCSRCNHKLLGSANDDPVRLRKAADYLEQYQPREVFGERKFIPGTRPEAS